MIATETLHPQYLKAQDGHAAFVVLPAAEFEELIEDYNDLIVIEERKSESTISLSDLKQSLSDHANV